MYYSWHCEYTDDRKEHNYLPHQERELLLQNVCNGKIKGLNNIAKIMGNESMHPKCHFVHHFRPYLYLGPFHIEIQYYFPLRSVFHDFFSHQELEWIKEYTEPILSESRYALITNNKSKSEKTNVISVEHSSIGNSDNYVSYKDQVTLPMSDILYDEEEEYVRLDRESKILEYEVLPLRNPYTFTIKNAMLFMVSKRIELATQLNVTTRHGSTTFKATNYGLSGSLLTHVDPLGYEKGVPLAESKLHLMRTGDFIASFMGWFAHTGAGGSTGFTTKKFEGRLVPRRGSAGFWINLFNCHERDMRSMHAGCPVLKGSKWILNKWINSYDQWKYWPCYLKQHVSFDVFKGLTW